MDNLDEYGTAPNGQPTGMPGPTVDPLLARLTVRRYALPPWCERKWLRASEGLFDHWGEDVAGRLVTEPYGHPIEIMRRAEQFAHVHGLQFAVEPLAYVSERATRVVFWSKHET